MWVYITLTALLVSAYLFVSVRIKIRNIRQIKLVDAKTSGMFQVLTKEIKLLKVGLRRLEKEKDAHGEPYSRLSKIYDFNIKFSSEFLQDRDKLIEFLHDKFIAVHKIILYVLDVHGQMIIGNEVSSNIIAQTIDKSRSKLVTASVKLLGAEFAKVNTEANESCFNDAKLTIFEILSDKKKNDKTDRIIGCGGDLLSASMRITILEYDRYVKSKADIVKKFDQLIVKGKLHEAAILLLKFSPNKTDVYSTITDIVELEIKKAEKLMSEKEAEIETSVLSEKLKTIRQNNIDGNSNIVISNIDNSKINVNR